MIALASLVLYVGVTAAAVVFGLGTIIGAIAWTGQTAQDESAAWWVVVAVEVGAIVAAVVAGAHRLRSPARAGASGAGVTPPS